MRRMFSEKQIKEFAKYVLENNVVEAIAGKDIAPASVTTEEINGIENPCVKPIYYHPVYMFGSDTSENLIRILITILDNSPIQYNDGTIVTKLNALLNAGAIINVDGIVIDTNNNNANAYMIKNDGSINQLFWNKETTRGEIDFSTITWTEVIDGVNKIN